MAAEHGNQGVLSISQDSLGKAATTFRPSGAAAPNGNSLYPYWAGPLSDGVVIGLVAANYAGTLSVNFAGVPGLGSGSFSWTEFYSGKTGSGTSVSFNLGLHDMAVIKVTKGGGAGGPTSTSAPGQTSTFQTSTSAAPPANTSSAPVGQTQTHWGQCGGKDWIGPTAVCLRCYEKTTAVLLTYVVQCESPYKCTVSNG